MRPSLARNAIYMIFMAFSVLTQPALAAPEVTLSVKVEKEVSSTDANGQVTTVRQPANEAEPGDTLFYTLTYANQGDEAASNVKLDNPIPDGTAYVGNSAWGQGADIQFSIDGGQTFKKPASLTYRANGGENRTASPEEYTSIRWLIPAIAPGSSGEAGFTALVK